MSPPTSPRPAVRAWIVRPFTTTEDVVYIGLGLLLASSALTLLVTGVIGFGQSVVAGKVSIIDLTVQVSLREHALVPKPFLLVGLISVIRRVLVLTAEFNQLHEKTASISQHFAIQLAVLTVLILALVIPLVLLPKSSAPVVAERA
jgi:hypothetical protein